MAVALAFSAAPALAAAKVEVRETAGGIVVAGHPEAAAIGTAVLAAGGNAMDAAVAVSLALGVAEPYGSGLGGKLVLLHHSAETGAVEVVEALDAVPAAGTFERYEKTTATEREDGWLSVAVPGLPAGLYRSWQRWGTRPWAELVAPAIELAERGPLLRRGNVRLIAVREKKIHLSAECARIFWPGGQPPEAGLRLPQPDLARTLRALAEHGPDGFYRGPVAAAIVNASRAGGGLLTLDDLAAYTARDHPPLRLEFGAYELFGAPPPSTGGPISLLTLAALDGAKWQPGGLRTPSNLNLLGHALRAVYPRVQATAGDRPEARAEVDALFAKEGMQRLRRAIRDGLQRPAPAKAGAEEGQGPSTTHFVVVDAAGNAVSATQSLSHHFGSGIVPPGTGVVLNNSMSNAGFRTKGAINAVAPGLRPRSTITPTIVRHRGVSGPAGLKLVAGLPGGGRIPSAMLQLLVDVLAFDTPLPDAVAAQRFHLERPLNREAPDNQFEFEGEVDPALASGLQAAGWRVRQGSGAETYGGYCAVALLPDGRRQGVADLRRTNAVRTTDAALAAEPVEAPASVESPASAAPAPAAP